MKEDLVQNDPTVPVYLFTGFLDAGKTKFIQETLADKRFNKGERTLILACEEGEEEYDLSAFKKQNVFLRVVEDESQLTSEYLAKLTRDLVIERVMVEYNGMWMLDTLYQNMPKDWVVYQEFMFAEYSSFLSYNANMRQLVYDKLSSCELIVFNRAPEKFDMSEYHKIVRAANRRCDIAYERANGKVVYDETVDPLPFDVNAPVVEIADRDYAIWYRDLSEELKKYNGKTVRFKGQLVLPSDLPDSSFIIGRKMMNCCAADVSFAGLAVDKTTRDGRSEGEWITLTARIEVRKHPAYNRAGPVLIPIAMQPDEAPADDVATFY